MVSFLLSSVPLAFLANPDVVTSYFGLCKKRICFSEATAYR